MKRSREPEPDLDSLHAQPSAGSDEVTQHFSKITGLDSAVTDDEDDEDTAVTDNKDRAVAMKCTLPPHKEPLTFKSYGEYESHYNKFHTNRCLECRKNFPSDHFLGLHIEECHDPLVVVKRDKGEHTYSCFVEGCERKCMTHQKRRMHMIDKHMYPKNYFFAVTKDGVDGRRSLLVEGGHHRRKSSTSVQLKETRRRASLLEGGTSQPNDKQTQPAPSSNKSEGKEEAPDTEMSDLAGAMSALQFVPPSVRFGRGRAGFPRR